MSLLTNDKITEIFCAADEFCKEYSQTIKENRQTAIGDGKKHRNCQHEMSDSEIITILILYHFGAFNNFKHFYLHYIKVHLKKDFPESLSYNRFVAIEHKVFIPVMLFSTLSVLENTPKLLLLIPQKLPFATINEYLITRFSKI